MGKIRSIFLHMTLVLILIAACGGSDDQSERSADSSELARIKELQAGAKTHYDRFRLDVGKEGAREKTLAWLLEQDGVARGGIAEDGETLWVVLDSGIELDMIVDRPR